MGPSASPSVEGEKTPAERERESVSEEWKEKNRVFGVLGLRFGPFGSTFFLKKHLTGRPVRLKAFFCRSELGLLMKIGLKKPESKSDLKLTRLDQAFHRLGCRRLSHCHS